MLSMSRQVRAELETKLRSEESQREDLNRRVEDYFREITQLRERIHDGILLRQATEPHDKLS